MKTLFFIHGWPDSEKIWDKQIAYFKDTYHCHATTLPGFSENEEEFDFPQIVDYLVQEIKTLKSPVILVGHDWGAYLSYMIELKHPELVEKVIGLDVGAGGVESFKDLPLAATYQGLLSASWLLRKKLPGVGQKITSLIANLAKAPIKEDIQMHKNFIYYYFWRDLLLPKYRKNLLIKYRPKSPLLYIYSESKPLMFHSRGWLRSLEKRSDCQVRSVKGVGHWFMYEKPELINPMIEEWLNKQ